MAADPLLVPVGPATQQVLAGTGQPGSSVLLVNPDITQTAYAGYRSSIAPGGTNTIAIPPLGSAAVDASRTIYACAPAAMLLQVVPGGTSWAPSPAQISAQISALGLARDTSVQATTTVLNTGIALPSGAARDTSVQAVSTTLGTPAQTVDIAGLPGGIASSGVPLLAKRNNLTTQTSQLILAGGTNTYGPFTLTQMGYDIVVNLSANAAATMPFAQVTMTWSDSATGVIVAQETWYLAASSAGNSRYYGGGPVKGDTLNVAITNQDPARTLSLSNLVISQTSRFPPRDDWQNSGTFSAVPGFTMPGLDQSANMLCLADPNIGAGASATRLCDLYAGQAQICVNGPGQTGNVLITVPAEDNAGQASSTIYNGLVSATVGLMATVALPRAQVLIKVTNTGGAGGNFSFVVYRVETPL